MSLAERPIPQEATKGKDKLIKRVEKWLQRSNDPLWVIQKIGKISEKAATVHIKMKGDTAKKYDKAAKKIEKLITPEILDNPAFYSQLAPRVHVTNLQLLLSLIHIPVSSPEPTCDIPGVSVNELRAKIVTYMSGIASSTLEFPFVGEFAYEKNREENLSKYLRTVLLTKGKGPYLEEVFKDSRIAY